MLLYTRLISARDKQMLSPAVEHARNHWTTYAPYLDSFAAELRRARAVPPSDIPDDVITMNSRFTLWLDRIQDTVSYTLVYPELGAPHHGRLSVLTPMGLALLGARVGDTVCWDANDGPEVATVQSLTYQPEREGDDHL